MEARLDRIGILELDERADRIAWWRRLDDHYLGWASEQSDVSDEERKSREEQRKKEKARGRKYGRKPGGVRGESDEADEVSEE